jgi:hypothetical protein
VEFFVGLRFIPEASPSGGTQLGNSYLTTWTRCPRAWFNEFYRPVLLDSQTVGRGITPRFKKIFLISGGIFHEMLAAWYASGCRDGEDTGEYDIDKALETGRLEWLKAKREYESEELAEKDWLMNQKMILDYHDRFGPGAPMPDYPDIRVVCDGSGEPLVERPWTCTLMDGYVYTCRTDLIVYERGYLKVMEHKTSKANWVWTRQASIPYDSQFTGE